jgi:hypothetical protein
MLIEQTKSELHKILKRDVLVEQTKTGKWICQYVEYGMSPMKLVGDTQEAAYENLLAYLITKSSTGDTL